MVFHAWHHAWSSEQGATCRELPALEIRAVIVSMAIIVEAIICRPSATAGQ